MSGRETAIAVMALYCLLIGPILIKKVMSSPTGRIFRLFGVGLFLTVMLVAVIGLLRAIG